MAYLTLASSCIAYTAYAWLAKNTTPALVGTYSYVNPAIAAVLGWWFLGETVRREPAGRHGGDVRRRRAGELAAGDDKQGVKRLDEDEQKDPSTAGRVG